jgi:predicted Rossmann fold flavoprotein
MKDNGKTIAVVGGGPAGMMAAIRASQLAGTVVLIERNKALGKKLLLSGNGRSNLTNAASLEVFVQKYGRNGAFLRDAFKQFFNMTLIRFFESRGLPLVTESDGRVFPATHTASNVCDLLVHELKELKVAIKYGLQVTDISIDQGKVKAVCLNDGTKIAVDCVVLATGGITYRSTGSDGAGLRIAQKLGHSVVSLRPGLVPLQTDKNLPRALAGLSLNDVQVIFIGGNKKIVSEIGDLLVTNHGISGPIILSISGRVLDFLDKGIPVSASIDLHPRQSVTEVEVKLLADIHDNPKKNIASVLDLRYPKRLSETILKMGALDPLLKVSHLKVHERKKIVAILKGIPLTILGCESVEIAMITRGGVSLKEIDPRTMSSRLIQGLFFAGEMIDLDGDTGGYNLQEAFSTGFLAGESAVKYVRS